jgi:hypothetical protein
MDDKGLKGEYFGLGASRKAYNSRTAEGYRDLDQASHCVILGREFSSFEMYP